MMSFVFGLLLLASLVTCALTASPALVLESMLAGAADAVTLCLSLTGAYMLFLGLIRIAEEAGLMQALSRRMKRLVCWLIPNAGDAAGPITLNLAANILGLGNAATPFGLAAMEAMQRDNKDKTRATHGMCMFLCLNAAGFQLIPSTVIALRAAAGSSDPARVIVPSLIACAVSTAVAILGCRLLRRLFP